MIAYDLICGRDHVFEGWFENAAAYDAQKERNLIACPSCGSTDVRRTPSTFGIARHRGEQPAEETVHPAEQLRRFIENHFEDVGANFAKEALKMHYQVSETRNIRGVSTEQEEELLKQEGISFFKLPLPIDRPPDPEE